MSDLVATVIPAAAGILGGVIGTFGTLLVSASQSRRDAATQLATEIRTQERLVAERCSTVLLRISVDLPALYNMRRRDDQPRQRALEAAVKEAQTEFSLSVLALPRPHRERAEALAKLLWRADELGPHWYQSPYEIVRLMTRDLRELLASCIRSECPPAPSFESLELQTSFDDLMVQRAEEYSHEEAEYQNDREEWYERHPHIRPRST